MAFVFVVVRLKSLIFLHSERIVRSTLHQQPVCLQLFGSILDKVMIPSCVDYVPRVLSMGQFSSPGYLVFASLTTVPLVCQELDMLVGLLWVFFLFLKIKIFLDPS